jgi:cytochrome c oxidase cbb3-type subunit 1
MFAQYSAVISTIAIEIVVTTVIINFFMTWRGSEGTLQSSIPIRWFWTGALCYFITCTQCAFQVTLTFQQVIHFTDWVVGHAHLVMFGVFSFWLFGMIEHLWPKLTGNEWWSGSLRKWSYWMITVGLGGMFLSLTAGGIADGFMAMNLSPRESILEMLRPFWFTRTLTGLSIIAGYSCMVLNMAMTSRASHAAHVDTEYAPYEGTGEKEAAVGTV